mmetsp:Transcript_15701/g.15103  ORF Transcript_15701/g.15103 Transcript_15701/m.15103 type:complete len:98 (-) Transcript_15701:79-372(-)
MKSFAVTASVLLLASSANAFAPATSTPLFGISRDSVCLNAKHVQKKATKRTAHRRPRKSRLSDINRKPTDYPTFEKPSEYTISAEPATSVAKPTTEE